MMHSDEQLRITRQQLSLMEDALASLLRSNPDTAPALLRVMAEGMVDQIHELRDEIDDYIGMAQLAERELVAA